MAHGPCPVGNSCSMHTWSGSSHQVVYTRCWPHCAQCRACSCGHITSIRTCGCTYRGWMWVSTSFLAALMRCWGSATTLSALLLRATGFLAHCQLTWLRWVSWFVLMPYQGSASPACTQCLCPSASTNGLFAYLACPDYMIYK